MSELYKSLVSFTKGFIDSMRNSGRNRKTITRAQLMEDSWRSSTHVGSGSSKQKRESAEQRLSTHDIDGPFSNHPDIELGQIVRCAIEQSLNLQVMSVGPYQYFYFNEKRGETLQEAHEKGCDQCRENR